MKKIAVANMKGGVGKTTTSIVLCDTLSAVGGKRVLALDLDSQANMSWAMLSPGRFEAITANALMSRWLAEIDALQLAGLADILQDVSLKADVHWRPLSAPTSPPAATAIAVADPRMRFEEMKFEGPSHADPAIRLGRELDRAIRELGANYDYCVMDCSPALSALTRAGLRIADAIIVPTPLNHLCLQSALNFQDLGLRQLLKAEGGIFVLPTRVGMSTGRSEADRVRQLLKEYEQQGRWQRLDPEFPESVEYMRALNPPALGPHPTLKARYGGRRGDLKRFLESLEDKGIVQ